MKNLLLIVVALFTINGLFAQNPELDDAKFTRGETMDNVYYLDYSQYVTSTNTMEWGAGHVDLDLSDQARDDEYNTLLYKVEALPDCQCLKVTAKYPQNSGYHIFKIKFVVYDTQNLKSNVGEFSLRINWETNPDHLEDCNCGTAI